MNKTIFAGFLLAMASVMNAQTAVPQAAPAAPPKELVEAVPGAVSVAVSEGAQPIKEDSLAEMYAGITALMEQEIDSFKKTLGEFREKVVPGREVAFKELQSALQDGDPVLIDKGVSLVYLNASRSVILIKSQTDLSDRLQWHLSDLYGSDRLEKSKYVETRNMWRDGLSEMQKPISEADADLLRTARNLVPASFTSWEEIMKDRLSAISKILLLVAKK